jgi:ADP-ribose pyrophosphatase
MSGEVILDTRYLYRGRVVTLRVDRVRLPGVDEPFAREVVEHRPAVAIVALDDAGAVLLVWQTRAAAGGRIWEVPDARRRVRRSTAVQ